MFSMEGEEVEISLLTNSMVQLGEDEEGPIISLFFGRMGEEPKWTHAACFTKETASKLLAQLNLMIQNFPS
jgi:hypothetical protein